MTVAEQKKRETAEELAKHLPDDFCRSCYGKGWVNQPGDRPGVTVGVTCYSCDGSGWGT